MRWHGRLRSSPRFLNRTKLGQISILIVFSLVPMFTLFAFVINIGMMVNAKIALQNAVDGAAYAGAATQARMMTDISHLNYYMREVYKKFIFKYYVLGNVSQRCFPKKGAGKMPQVCSKIDPSALKAFDWTNRDAGGNIPPKGGFPGIPVVCISLSKESNPCQVTTVVPVVKPPPCGVIDPACAALQAAAMGIGAAQTDSCAKSSVINQEVLANWLYATDYDRLLQSNLNLQGLISDDIGLMTEEMLTYQRIKNIVDIINTEPSASVTVASEAAIESGKNTLSHARTILAFKTLSNGLNQTVFEPESIDMTELIQPPLLLIKPVEIKTDLGITYMQALAPAAGADPNAPTDCAMSMSFFPADVLTGVSKSKLSHVYYALKATAKARILFYPFPFGGSPAEEVTLTAYAAAMPFGSRIGPDLSTQSLADEEYLNVNGQAFLSTGGGNFTARPTKYPRVKVDDNGHTSESSDVLSGFFEAMNTFSTGNSTSVGTGNVGKDNLIAGLHAALLPDLYELGRYNIPGDSDTIGGRPGFLPYYVNGVDSPSGPTYSIWAPFIAEGKNDAFTDAMNAEIDNIITLAGSIKSGGAKDPLGDSQKKVQAGLRGSLATLEQTLLARNGYNVFQMPDPLSTAYYQNNTFPAIPGKVTSSNPQSVGPLLASSWTTDHDQTYFTSGRDGYSVKLIPFKILLSHPGKVTNDPSGAANWPPIKGGFTDDQSELQKTAH